MFFKFSLSLGVCILTIVLNMFFTGFIVWYLWTTYFPAPDQPQYLSFVVGLFIMRILVGGPLLPKWLRGGSESE